MAKQHSYHYVAYHVAGQRYHEVINDDPVEYVLNLSREYSDSPYILLFSREITKAQYENWKDEIA